MKTTGKRLVFWLSFLALTAGAYAQSPREQLQQMVEQLQKAPSDNALRERIIKLALTVKPSPVLPPEAERRMVRGAAAFSGATSLADYQAAAKEFEQATLAAPWYGDAYYNLGVAQDKAEDYDAALRSLKLAALASPDSKAAEKLSYAVEFRKEKAAKANSPEARAAKEKEAEQRFIASLEGARFSCDEVRGVGNDTNYHRPEFEIRAGKIKGVYVITRLTPHGETIGGSMRVGNRLSWFSDAPLKGRVNVFSDGWADLRVEMHDDRLMYAYPARPTWFAQTCRRQ